MRKPSVLVVGGFLLGEEVIIRPVMVGLDPTICWPLDLTAA
jgi:hypothetical protein